MIPRGSVEQGHTVLEETDFTYKDVGCVAPHVLEATELSLSHFICW